MIKKTTTKLILNTQTIRVLESRDLQGVVGGTRLVNPIDPVTATTGGEVETYRSCLVVK